MIKNYIFLINIILNVSTKLAITGSLSRLLHSLTVLAIRKCVGFSKLDVSFYCNFILSFIISIQNKECHLLL